MNWVIEACLIVVALFILAVGFVWFDRPNFDTKEKKVATPAPIPTRDVSTVFNLNGVGETLKTIQELFEQAKQMGVPEHATVSIYVSMYRDSGTITFAWKEPLKAG